MVRLEGCVLTHEGCVRKNNEDNYILFGNYKRDVSECRKSLKKKVIGGRRIVAVFDGMGGEEFGEKASLIAAKSFSPCAIKIIEEEIARQFDQANEKLCKLMSLKDYVMGTTAVMIYFDGDSAICANLGDSRAYLYRHGELRQLSVDHSEAQKLIDSGDAAYEDVRNSVSWHRLTQHLGIPKEEFTIQPEISDEIMLCDGDVFLLSSDGLTDMVDDTDMERIIDEGQAGGSLTDIAGRLIGKAIEHGGEDNVTVLLVRVNI